MTEEEGICSYILTPAHPPLANTPGAMLRCDYRSSPTRPQRVLHMGEKVVLYNPACAKPCQPSPYPPPWESLQIESYNAFAAREQLHTRVSNGTFGGGRDRKVPDDVRDERYLKSKSWWLALLQLLLLRDGENVLYLRWGHSCISLHHHNLPFERPRATSPLPQTPLLPGVTMRW